MSRCLDLEKSYLTFPGNGVHTVKTAEDKKKAVIKKLYGVKTFEEAHTAWLSSFDHIDSNIFLLGVPSDVGAGIVRGSNWGPLALREKIEDQYFDLGDIKVIPHLIHDKYLNDSTIKKIQDHLKRPDLPVCPLSILEKVSGDFFSKSKDHLLILGGDHSISRPILESYLDKNSDVGILHFDAHTDLMESRLGVDQCFATWAYHICKKLDNPQKMIQVGIRSSGKDKGYWENLMGLTQYWTKDVENVGVNELAKKIVEQYQKTGCKKLYMSFDIDVFDVSFASATGTPEANGLSPKIVLDLLNEITKYIPIHTADLVEVAPFISYPEYKDLNEPTNTINSAMSIIDFLFSHWRK